jgi:hypothetical protein
MSRGRRSRGAVAASRPTAIPPVPPNSTARTPRAQQLSDWATQFCSDADGRWTLDGLGELGPINAYSDLLVPTGSPASPKKELAVEQILHLIEGWRNIASATAAYLRHSEASTIHLAYYAELRAVSSLFAWSGIRLRYASSYYVDRHGLKKTHHHSPPTHAAAWALWSEWVKRRDSSDLFLDKIKLHPQITLRDVQNATAFAAPQRQLRHWGVDLVSVAADHDARNTYSYETWWATKPLSTMQVSDVELVRELWALLLIDGSALSFDSAIITRMVEQAVNIEQVGGKSVEDVRVEVAQKISASTGVHSSDVLRRLDSSTYPDRPFILAASTDIGVSNILCRAFFLLRMATLALKSSLEMSGNVHATAWLKNWLQHAGIWNAQDSVELIDVEIDYRDAVSGFAPEDPLPGSLWKGENLISASLLIRPDACIAWSLVA